MFKSENNFLPSMLIVYLTMNSYKYCLNVFGYRELGKG